MNQQANFLSLAQPQEFSEGTVNLDHLDVELATPRSRSVDVDDRRRSRTAGHTSPTHISRALKPCISTAGHRPSGQSLRPILKLDNDILYERVGVAQKGDQVGREVDKTILQRYERDFRACRWCHVDGCLPLLGSLRDLSGEMAYSVHRELLSRTADVLLSSKASLYLREAPSRSTDALIDIKER